MTTTQERLLPLRLPEPEELSSTEGPFQSLRRLWQRIRQLFLPVPNEMKLTDTSWLGKLISRLLVYAAVLACLGSAAAHHAVMLLVGFSILLVFVGAWCHQMLAAHPVKEAKPWFRLFALIGLAAIGVIVLMVGHWHFFTPVGFTGLSFLGFGVGQLVAQAREERWLNRAILALCGSAIVVALVLFLMVHVGGWTPLILIVALPAPLLSFGTQAILDRRSRKRKESGSPGWVSGVAIWISVIALLIAGLFLMSAGGFKLVVLIFVVSFAVVGMIASDTDADVIFFFVAFALVWAEIPSTGESQPSAANSQHFIAVFGDSYISGEGAKTFYAGTNTTVPSTYDKCRRSPTAWAPIVAQETNEDLEFLACSGAKAANITTAGQYIGENEASKRAVTDHKRSQIEEYRDQRMAAPPDFVFVSIGGNDVGFGDLVHACLTPGDCSEIGQNWLDRLKTLPSKLDAVYTALSAEPGFRGKVVAVPYPVPIRDGNCSVFDSTFTPTERRFLHEFTEQLDIIVQQAAARNKVLFLDSVPEAFATDPEMQICNQAGNKVGVNFVALNPVQGRIDPLDWTHNSLHPNEVGHRRLADTVETWLKTANHTPQDIAKVAGSTLDLDTLMKAPDASAGAKTTTPEPIGSWELRQTRAALRARIIGILLVFGACWLLWIAILDALRRRNEQAKRDRAAASPGSTTAPAIPALVARAMASTT